MREEDDTAKLGRSDLFLLLDFPWGISVVNVPVAANAALTILGDGARSLRGYGEVNWKKECIYFGEERREIAGDV